jgi:uncharacterized membrane protein SpoIIM required for sporulation
LSLKETGSRIKEGAKELTSAKGLQHVFLNMGIGVVIGVLVDLLLEGIFRNLVYPNVPKDPDGGTSWRIKGFSIFIGYNNLFYDDIILIVLTVLMLFTKKLWVTVGFFVGWYFSSYYGLYNALGLPHPESG